MLSHNESVRSMRLGKNGSVSDVHPPIMPHSGSKHSSPLTSRTKPSGKYAGSNPSAEDAEILMNLRNESSFKIVHGVATRTPWSIVDQGLLLSELRNLRQQLDNAMEERLGLLKALEVSQARVEALEAMLPGREAIAEGEDGEEDDTIRSSVLSGTESFDTVAAPAIAEAGSEKVDGEGTRDPGAEMKETHEAEGSEDDADIEYSETPNGSKYASAPREVHASSLAAAGESEIEPPAAEAVDEIATPDAEEDDDDDEEEEDEFSAQPQPKAHASKGKYEVTKTRRATPVVRDLKRTARTSAAAVPNMSSISESDGRGLTYAVVNPHKNVRRGTPVVKDLQKTARSAKKAPRMSHVSEEGRGDSADDEEEEEEEAAAKSHQTYKVVSNPRKAARRGTPVVGDLMATARESRKAKMGGFAEEEEEEEENDGEEVELPKSPLRSTTTYKVVSPRKASRRGTPVVGDLQAIARKSSKATRMTGFEEGEDEEEVEAEEEERTASTYKVVNPRAAVRRGTPVVKDLEKTRKQLRAKRMGGLAEEDGRDVEEDDHEEAPPVKSAHTYKVVNPRKAVRRGTPVVGDLEATAKKSRAAKMKGFAEEEEEAAEEEEEIETVTSYKIVQNPRGAPSRRGTPVVKDLEKTAKQVRGKKKMHGFDEEEEEEEEEEVVSTYHVVQNPRSAKSRRGTPSVKDLEKTNRRVKAKMMSGFAEEEEEEGEEEPPVERRSPTRPSTASSKRALSIRIEEDEVGGESGDGIDASKDPAARVLKKTPTPKAHELLKSSQLKVSSPHSDKGHLEETGEIHVASKRSASTSGPSTSRLQRVQPATPRPEDLKSSPVKGAKYKPDIVGSAKGSKKFFAEEDEAAEDEEEEEAT